MEAQNFGYIKTPRQKKCHCKQNCKCKSENFGDSIFGDSKAESYTTLEEHFENFGEMAAENFAQFGLIRRALSTKKERARQAERQAARQQKKMTRITGKEAIIKAKQEAKLSSIAAGTAAEAQAATTNQLASQVTPTAAPISSAQSPMAASSEGAPSYATLPMPSGEPSAQGGGGLQSAFGQKPMNTEEETPTEETATPETVKEATKPKMNMTLYIIIAVVVLGGAYFLMKKK